MGNRIALVTCATLSGLDPDDQPLIELLRTIGIEPIAAVWDDPAVDWESFDLAVVRSTWDYPARRGDFLKWAHKVPRLANPADVIAWNTDKRYLRELTTKGIPVVPTTWLDAQSSPKLPTHGRFVLKPSVGAGSLDAAAFTMHDEHEQDLAREHAQRLTAAGQTVMLQPYLEDIETLGEICLIFLGGEFSHAINKGAMLAGDRSMEAGGLFLAESIEARQPAANELELAMSALAAVPGGPDRLTYARVDLVTDSEGKPVLMELELTEPSLYLSHSTGAAERFAYVIAAQIERPGARPSAACPAPSSRRESSPDR